MTNLIALSCNIQTSDAALVFDQLPTNASAIAKISVSSLLNIGKCTNFIEPTTKVKKRQSLLAESFLVWI